MAARIGIFAAATITAIVSAVSGAIAGPIVPLDLRTLYLKDLSFHGCTQQADSVFADLIGYIPKDEKGVQK